MTIAIALTGCGQDGTLDPEGPAAVSAVAAPATGTLRAPDLTGCEQLQPVGRTELTARLYARGDQIYRWDGSTWAFVAPSARLFADPEEAAQIGRHYGGPTWESQSGSKFVGAVLERCTPDGNAVPWLLLRAVTTEGPGLFNGIAYIQRVNTVAGKAPARQGAFLGETVYMPYSAEYLLYRSE